MPLSVAVSKKQEGIFMVSPVGSIDSETYKDLEKKINSILDASTKVIILDMEGVSYISSMGLGVIFRTKEAVKKIDGVFIIVNLQPQIKKVLEIVKVLKGIDVFASVEEADAYLGKIQRGEL